MDTITKIYEVFTFGELSERAKDTVRDSGLTGDHWNGEAWDSLKAWRELLGFTYSELEIEYFHVFGLKATTANEYHDVELSGDRLRRWIINNHGWALTKGKYYYRNGKSRRSKIITETAMPTGYCLDLDFIEPLLQFLNGWGTCMAWTWEDVIEECIRAWAKSLQSEIDYQYTDEYISEHCEANEYRFLADGTFYRG